MSADKQLDIKTGSSQDGQGNDVSEGHEVSAYIDPVKEAKMMRKFDIWAIGGLGILSNIGNAQIAGLPADLGLTGNQYGTAVTLLYATYVPFEGPVAILLKIIGPKHLLTFCCLAWGIVCLGTGFVHNWQGLYACRMLIGFFEAGLIPCINVYIGMVYKKSERGKRSSIIFAFSAIASAFGGIFAYALTQIRTGTYFSTWRALFIVEGCMTIVIAPLFWLFFPATPKDAWFLTPEEKEMMKLRYELEPSFGIDEEFSWKAVIDGLIDPKFHLHWIFQFAVDISLYGFTTFLPAIVNGLGYTSVTANLMTVPIYVWGLITFLFTAYMSDKTGNRGYWIGGPLVCLIIGYALLISVDNLGVRYFACFVAVMGIYPTTGMSLMWLSDNAAQHFKRATMVGGALTLGNTAGVAPMARVSDDRVRERKISVLESYIKQLQDENEELKRKTSLPSQASPSASQVSDQIVVNTEAHKEKEEEEEEEISTAEVVHPVIEQRICDPAAPRPVYVGAAAFTAFANILWHDGPTPPRNVKVFKHPTLQRAIKTDYKLPNYTYANLLVQVVLRFIGSDYHLLKKKSFSQRVDRLYGPATEQTPDTMFLCRLFAVFALGELYLKKSTSQREVPGAKFFLQSVSLFEELYEEPNIEYIETLLLMCFYSHALNRQNTAYTYAGIALRLSVTMGLHRNITYDPKTPPVEIENRRRVWWTVYTFDRLCSAKLGHPVMIKDEDIDAPFPSSDGLSAEEQEEFVDAGQLIANIRLARITGLLLDHTYKIHSPHEKTFVSNVHRILTSLKEWDATLPPELALDHSRTPSYSTRAVASLRLHFNQLWVDGAIATFGYFDAHFIFSSTIILILSNILNPNDGDRNSVDLACTLLQSMADDGNLPAAELRDRLATLKEDLESKYATSSCQVTGPKQGYMTAAGTFAAHVAPTSSRRKGDPNRSQTGQTPSTTTSPAAEVSSVGRAPFDDPFIQDFLGQPYSEWSPSAFDITNDEIGVSSLAWDIRTTNDI
ncbi:putative transporter [Colletotrichum sp. SAR 10_75]|nr:putative transporter [Colletotrichum sp. SAR 10_75]